MQLRNSDHDDQHDSNSRPQYRHFVDPFFLEMDFTGTDYDTFEKCQYRGLRFSGEDTPWPFTLVYPVSGSWLYSAGNGWQAVPNNEEMGPALLIPLLRPANWILEIKWKYAAAAITEQGILAFGYIANSNQPGAYARIEDLDAAATEMDAHLDTNNGNDTYTEQYNGASLAGSATRTYRFRCMHGTVGVWDDQDDAWHDYLGRYGVIPEMASIPYTAAWAFLQSVPPYDQAPNFWTAYLSSLKLGFFY